MDTHRSAWCKGCVAVGIARKVRQGGRARGESGGAEGGPSEALGLGGLVGGQESTSASAGRVALGANRGVVVDVLGHGLVAGPRGATDAGVRVGVVEEERQDVVPVGVGLLGPLAGLGV